MHASCVLGTRASAPCAVNRRRAKLRALCGCAVAKSTAKRALILREAIGRRRSPGALGAPWRVLSRDFGVCGLPSMPQTGISRNRGSLICLVWTLPTRCETSIYVLEMTDVDLKSAIFFAARAFRRCAGPFTQHGNTSGTLITSLDGHATFYIHGKWNVSREWARTAAKCTSSEKNGRC